MINSVGYGLNHDGTGYSFYHYQYYENYWFLCDPIYMKCLVTNFLDEIIIALKKRGTSGFGDIYFSLIAEANRLDLYKIIYSATNHFNKDSYPMEVAAKGEYWEMVKYLCDKGADSSSIVMDLAASGKLEIVEWLHNNRSENCSTDAMDNAATSGNLEIVEWLHYNRTEGCSSKAIEDAASNGHFKVVEFLHKNRSEENKKAFVNAAKNGHFDIVKYFIKNGHFYDQVPAALGVARRNQHSKFQKYLKKIINYTIKTTATAK